MGFGQTTLYNKSSSGYDDSNLDDVREVTDLAFDDIDSTLVLDRPEAGVPECNLVNKVLVEPTHAPSLAGRVNTPFSLKNLVVTTKVDEEVDEMTTTFIKGLICKLVDFLPVSLTPEMLLERRSKFMKTLDMIKNVISGIDDWHKAGFNWLIVVITQLFHMSEKIIAEDTVIKEGKDVNVEHIDELSKDLTDWLATKEALILELKQLLQK